jgi:hypothetical protein
VHRVRRSAAVDQARPSPTTRSSIPTRRKPSTSASARSVRDRASLVGQSLRKCWDARAGKHADVCPDASASESSPARKSALKIVKADAKRLATICKACGGPDKTCDGQDDFTPSAIGFPATCPGVQIPDGGPFCDEPIITLNDLIECTACITAHEVTCVDRLRVPQFAAYPCECTQ